MKDQFITTRPRLVTMLTRAGIKCERIVNPWSDTKSAWCVPINQCSADIVKQFYLDIGRPLPKTFQQMEQV